MANDNTNGSGNPLVNDMMKAPVQQVNLEVVNNIAHILDLARRGEVHGIIMVGINKHNNLTFDSYSIESLPLIPAVMGQARISLAKLEQFCIEMWQQSKQPQSKILRPAPGLRMD